MSISTFWLAKVLTMTISELVFFIKLPMLGIYVVGTCWYMLVFHCVWFETYAVCLFLLFIPVPV